MFRICRRIWNEAKQQRFSSFENLNSWLEARYRALWPEIQHPDYVGITLVDALEQEQLFLMPMPAPFDGYIEVLAGVSSTFLVTLLHNRYFPCLAVWPIKWLPFIGMSTVSRLFMTILWQPVIPVCWIVTRLAMTGSTIFRSSRKSRALYATAHRLQNYRHPCCNCRLHCGVESANKLIESWQKCSAWSTHGLEAGVGIRCAQCRACLQCIDAVETHQRAGVSGNNTETQGRTAGRYSEL